MVDRNDCGLDVLYESERAVVDIVAVHGLGGKRWDTWMAKSKPNKMWLKDFLPDTVPDARIMTYGYDARFLGSSRNSQSPYGHAKTLLARLSVYRRYTKTERRPIIFIAHSLGGIVVKSALIHAHLMGNKLEDYKAIKLSTHAILFFATPHQGSPFADWGRLFALIAKAGGLDEKLVGSLRLHSQWLQDQIDQFSGISNDFVTKYFYETIRPIVPGFPAVVPRYSAVVPGHVEAEAIEIRADHHTIVKYRTAEDDSYQIVSMHIALVCRDAEARVPSNWANANERLDTIFPSRPQQDKPTTETKAAGNINMGFRSHDIADQIREDEPNVECKWILENTEFMKWCTSAEHSILLLQGSAGNGKTMLSLYISEELSRAGHSDTVTYYACKSDHEENTVESVLKQSVYQISLSEGREKRSPALRGSMKVFQQLLDDHPARQSPRPGMYKYIIVDDFDGEGDFKGLLKRISSPETKWLFTCIRNPSAGSTENPTTADTENPTTADTENLTTVDIENLSTRSAGDSSKILCLDLDQQNAHTAAMRKLIESNVQAIASASLGARILTNCVLEKAEPINFLCAKLACGEVRQLMTQPDSQYEKAMELSRTMCLTGFQGLCERIFERIQPDLRDFWLNIFLNLLLVFRPVTLGELALLIGSANSAGELDAIEKQVRKWSPFVLVQNDTVCFAHYRVREFLKGKLLGDQMVQDKGHKNLAHHCLHYVCSGVLDRGPRPEPYPLLCWLDHATWSADKITDTVGAEYGFLRPNQTGLRKTWWDAYRAHFGFIGCGVDGNLLSRLAAFVHIKPTLGDILQEGRFDHRICLVVAACLGNKNVMECLLSQTQLSFGTALYAAFCAAAQRGNAGLAGRLLEYAMHLKNEELLPGDVGEEGELLRDAYAAASLGGFDALIELLPTIETDYNQKLVYHKARWPAALHAAALGGLHTLIDRLLEKVDDTLLDIVSANILEVASSAGHEVVVEKVLGSPYVGANATGKKFGRALQVAVLGGYDSITQLLLESGAEDYRGALTAAAVGGHTSMVKMLLEKYPALMDTGGRALRVAAQQGHLEIVSLLLEKKDYEDTHLRDALCAAAARDHSEVLMKIREKFESMVVLRGSRTPISLLAASSQQLLDINVVRLTQAAWRGDIQAVRSLLGSVKTEESIGDALEAAASVENLEVVELLLGDKRAKTKLGKVLRTAALRGLLAIVRLLMGAGGKEVAGSALWAAASRGDIKIVEYLCRNKVQVDEPGPKGRCALAAAADGGHGKVVELLLQNGADINHTDDDGKTALHLAARRMHETVIKLLILGGADTKLTDKKKRTPADATREVLGKKGMKASTDILWSRVQPVSDGLGEKMPPLTPAPTPTPEQKQTVTPLLKIEHIPTPLSTLIARKVAKRISKGLINDARLSGFEYPRMVSIKDSGQVTINPETAIWHKTSKFPLMVVEVCVDDPEPQKYLKSRAENWIRGSQGQIRVVLGITVASGGNATLALWRASQDAEPKLAVGTREFRNEKGKVHDATRELELEERDFAISEGPLEGQVESLHLNNNILFKCVEKAIKES